VVHRRHRLERGPHRPPRQGTRPPPHTPLVRPPLGRRPGRHRRLRLPPDPRPPLAPRPPGSRLRGLLPPPPRTQRPRRPGDLQPGRLHPRPPPPCRQLRARAPPSPPPPAPNGSATSSPPPAGSSPPPSPPASRDRSTVPDPKPCQCCGHLVLDRMPGSNATCPIPALRRPRPHVRPAAQAGRAGRPGMAPRRPVPGLLRGLGGRAVRAVAGRHLGAVLVAAHLLAAVVATRRGLTGHRCREVVPGYGGHEALALGG
jgi:hypothetical protein